MYFVRKTNDWKPNFTIGESFSSIYSQPDSNSEILHTVNIGCNLVSQRSADKWTEVRLPDDRVGWTNSVALKNSAIISGETIVNVAMKFLGTPYLWGGISPRGFDCSGFVQTVFRLCDIFLPRDSQIQATFGAKIEPNLTYMKSGDLLFFKEDKTVSHVAIYIENGRFIHSSGKVQINSLDENDNIFNPKLKERLHFARRILS